MSTGDPQCSECGQYLSLGHRATCGFLSRQTVSRLEDAIADHERGKSMGKTATRVMREGEYDAPADPWAHRSAGMRCRTCMWFVGKVKPGSDPLSPQEFGRCRRHAPTLQGWPAVYGSDWCGDHKLDEAKA